MNKHLKQLIELSDLDKAIDDFLPEEARINGALNALLEEQKHAGATIEELEIEITDARHKIAKSETHLADLTDRLSGHSRRAGELKSEKEIKAHSLEEEIAKEQVSFINEEIARIEKLQTTKSEEIAKLKARIAEIDAQVIDAKNANQETLAQLEDKRREVVTKREKLSEEIPPKVLGFYGKIRRWAGSRTVVQVKKQACYGCFMKISDKVYGEVINSAEIVTCPNCGCILYIAENAENTTNAVSEKLESTEAAA
ncbi:hypothetical protein AGMMS50229_17650 [Campylobacterota bacterium]|nr:hypothetical protein AGMMS50229_17650 [Campylobacterota bacterium]